MKTTSRLIFAVIGAMILCAPLFLARATTTIDVDNRYAYIANMGWLDWRADSTNGVVIGEYVCSGYIYAGNVGWIHLGYGVPANGIRYQNDSSADFGVNHDGAGHLRGFAYGANIGWINFEDIGDPRVDLGTGRFNGFAYSANCGWISLSNAFAYVQTDIIEPGADSDMDGIADAWELSYTNTLDALTADSNSDSDRLTDVQEAMADTNPLDPDDDLFITYFLLSNTNEVEMAWTAKPTRLYRVEHRVALDTTNSWEELVMGFESLPGWNNVLFSDTGSRNFYRVRVIKPLSP